MNKETKTFKEYYTCRNCEYKHFNIRTRASDFWDKFTIGSYIVSINGNCEKCLKPGIWLSNVEVITTDKA